MKNISIIVFLFALTMVSCQENREEEMIASFVKDLFDENITPDTVAQKYIHVSEDKENEFSIEKRKKMVIDHIQETRDNKTGARWLIPYAKIKNIKEPKIYPFLEVENLNKIDFGPKVKENYNVMYVLTNKEKTEILQYFLLTEDKKKLTSFTLMVKGGDIGYFFSY